MTLKAPSHLSLPVILKGSPAAAKHKGPQGCLPCSAGWLQLFSHQLRELQTELCCSPTLNSPTQGLLLPQREVNSPSNCTQLCQVQCLLVPPSLWAWWLHQCEQLSWSQTGCYVHYLLECFTHWVCGMARVYIHMCACMHHAALCHVCPQRGVNCPSFSSPSPICSPTELTAIFLKTAEVFYSFYLSFPPCPRREIISLGILPKSINLFSPSAPTLACSPLICNYLLKHQKCNSKNATGGRDTSHKKHKNQ